MATIGFGHAFDFNPLLSSNMFLDIFRRCPRFFYSLIAGIAAGVGSVVGALIGFYIGGNRWLAGGGGLGASIGVIATGSGVFPPRWIKRQWGKWEGEREDLEMVRIQSETERGNQDMERVQSEMEPEAQDMERIQN